MLHCVYHPIYSQLMLPPSHGFPITKYRHLYDYLTGTLPPEQLRWHRPDRLNPGQLTRCHCDNYTSAFLENRLDARAIRRIGFPWSQALVARTLTSVSGTSLTARLALKHGLALHLSGGYHHAHFDFGSGYCVFNDLVLAAEEALTQPGVDRVLIFDLDVHQGDGTAALCADRPQIISCSVHCESNFPSRKPPSNMDFPLEKGVGDAVYLQTVEQALTLALRLHQPDLVIFDAGVDVHQGDRLGHLCISDDGLRQREQLVLSTCRDHAIPLACVIGGGYDRDPDSLTRRHGQLFHAAFTLG
ncbi:histone deacetylase [Ferrimonas sediminicola]|uniref:Histone deacetylase n=1 Tax=Ferrimonas sediminicola TaxID=2569538 RepID=A0A4U1BBQ7_9GAMM|nr:histone deacetylase [Ferrimonas sediminicola]TKB48341.1 histone deacetylase [Ferrimonas sediminicola]